MKRFLALFVSAIPLIAQYSGPAILSRGDAPAAMSGPSISFRPFVEVSGIYNTGLAGVAVNSEGQVQNVSSDGVELAFGISGSHRWSHTEIGIDYHGDINHYFQDQFFDSTNHTLLLGIKHQFTRHISINIRNSAGTFTTSYPYLGLAQTVPFDPAQTATPNTVFFNNRTTYGNSVVDLVIQKSSRLSFDLGGGGFINRYRSDALYGANGATAHGDIQYRLSRRSTLGATYAYNHYVFKQIISTTDSHTADLTYAVQLSQRMEFTGYGGASRVETKFVQDVPVDPAITAILGITTGLRLNYSVRYVPDLSARISRTFPHGVFFINGGHTVIPGNGLFLTSTSTVANAGYNYTGLRRWSFNLNFGYNRNVSIGNVYGTYGGVSGGISASRQVSRSIHTIASFYAVQYDSPDFRQYNRVMYIAKLGIGFAPGDVPIRIW